MRALVLCLSLLLPACAGMPGWLDPTSLFDAPPPEAEADAPGPLAAPGDTPSIRLSWNGRQALALLIQQTGETRLWRSSGGLVVATEGARITATAGLREGIAATRLDGPDPLEHPLALVGGTATLRRQLDMMRSSRSPDDMRFGLTQTCRLTAGPLQEALLVQESCRGGGESFTNRYWADPASGGIYRSEQWIGEPGMMRLEVVIPPAS
jgi:hypothetical protein